MFFFLINKIADKFVPKRIEWPNGNKSVSIKRKSKGRNRESKRDWKVFLSCFFVL